MPGIGHVAVGMAGGRFVSPRTRGRLGLAAAMLVLSALSLLPDADGIAFTLGIPYENPFGHRGALHSLFVAVVVGLLAGAAARGIGLPFLPSVALVAALLASHDLLDTMTDGGLGIALLWPFSNERFFAPWRPIPVAPIGLGMLSEWGLRVSALELLYFSPLVAYALWPRRRRGAAAATGSEDS